MTKQATGKRPIYVRGEVRWFDAWALLAGLVFFGYLASIGALYLDASGHTADPRGCDAPLPVYLVAVGAANPPLSVYRFVDVRRGALLQLAANAGLACFGGFYFGRVGPERQGAVGRDLYCNYTVFCVSLVALVFQALYVCLLCALVAVIWLVGEKARTTKEDAGDCEDVSKDVEEWASEIG